MTGPPREQGTEPPSIELGGEGHAGKYPRLRFFPDRFVFATSPVRSGRHEGPLTGVRHVERVVPGRLGVRTGIDGPDGPRFFEVGLGPLSASDRLDEIDAFLGEHAAGHLYSIADEDGIRYSRDWRLDEVVTSLVPVTGVSGRGRRSSRRLRVETGAASWNLQLRPDRAALEVRRADDSRAASLLWIDTIYDTCGLVLGTLKASEAGNVTIAVGSGEVLEILAGSRKLLVDGAVVGEFRRKTIRFSVPQPEAFGLFFMLALYEQDMRAELEDRGKNRISRAPWFATLALGLVIAAQFDSSLGTAIALGVFVLPILVVAAMMWLRTRRRGRFTGGATDDLAERRRARAGPDPGA